MPDQHSVLADYAQLSLTELAAGFRTEHTAVISALADTVRHAIAAGEMLRAAKAQIPHGGWQAWLHNFCEVGEGQAERYMRLARARTENRLGETDLTGQSLNSLLRRLASPKPSKAKAATASRFSKAATGGLNSLAWVNATAAERSRFAEAVGLDTFIKALPAPSVTNEPRAIDDASLDCILDSLKLALSTSVEGEALAALAAIKRKLTARGRDLHDLAAVFSSSRLRNAA